MSSRSPVGQPAYMQEADPDDSDNGLEDSRQTATRSLVRERSNTSRMRRDRKLDKAPVVPPVVTGAAGSFDSDSTARAAAAAGSRRDSKPKTSPAKRPPPTPLRPPPKHSKTAPVVKTQRARAAEDSSHYGVEPAAHTTMVAAAAAAAAAAAGRPRAQTGGRPVSYAGPPSRPPLSASRFFPPPYPPPMVPSPSSIPSSPFPPPQMWPQGPQRQLPPVGSPYPTPSLPGPHVPPPLPPPPTPSQGYFGPQSSLAARFGRPDRPGDRPATAIGHRPALALAHRPQHALVPAYGDDDYRRLDDRDPDRRPSLTTRQREEDARRDMPPPPAPPPRPQSTRPSMSKKMGSMPIPLRRPSRVYDDVFDDLSNSFQDAADGRFYRDPETGSFREMAPLHGFADPDAGSFREASLADYDYSPVRRPVRRPSVGAPSMTYDLGAFRTEIASSVGNRRHSSYVQQYPLRLDTRVTHDQMMDRIMDGLGGQMRGMTVSPVSRPAALQQYRRQQVQHADPDKVHDQLRAAEMYQADMAGAGGPDGASMPLTAELLRRHGAPASSRSTRSSRSRDESDFRQSATTRTTRSSNNPNGQKSKASEDDVTIRIEGAGTLNLADGSNLRLRDGAKIHIARSAAAAAAGNGSAQPDRAAYSKPRLPDVGGSDRDGSMFDDRPSRYDRLPDRGRAVSQAGSFSRSSATPSHDYYSRPRYW